MGREKWLDHFRKMVRRKTNSLYYQSRRRPNRRISGQMGGDKRLDGFKSVIMYLQLSTQFEICTVKLHKILRYLDGFTHKKVGKCERFAVFFLNDENYDLLHNGFTMHGINKVTSLVEDYYEDYVEFCDKYSEKLTEVLPNDYRWVGRKPPRREDLCLVFQGKEGIELSEEIKEHYERTRTNWIWISLKDDKVVSLEDEYNKWEF